MQIKANYPLTKHNTFHIDIRASYFAEVRTIEDLNLLAKNRLIDENQRLILGGGSNILFTQDFDGIVIHPKFMGIERIDEDEKSVVFRAGSGLIWDDFVIYAIDHDWGGIENLSNIPGHIGAAPIQNIGAYGAEAREVIEAVEGFQISTRDFCKFSKKECHFSYRSSVFKEQLKNDFLITHVNFRLSKPPHSLNTSYGVIEEYLKNYSERSIATVRQAVISIRASKLPDPEKKGNAGSFFKNPVISGKQASFLKERFSDIPQYPVENDSVKIPAAWLIEHVECKGIRKGNAGTHEKQPLVLINYGKATGQEILDLAEFIREKVWRTFNIQLEPEVNIM
jgi:UDP-N-acetylmuramate dehydrogenase